jgi:DNA-binding LytR/AlgR family response regulator
MAKHTAIVVFDRVAIRVKNRNSWLIFNYSDIVAIRRDKDCAMSKIYLSDGRERHIDISLQILFDHTPVVFFRYGRFGLVNLTFLDKQIIDNKKMLLILKDGTEYLVSRKLHKEFHSTMKKIDISYPCEMCKFCDRSNTCRQTINFTKREEISL